MLTACPACTSPHKAEIEARLQRKESVRSVSRWLLEEKKVAISKSTLQRHAREHIALASQFADKILSLPRVALALVSTPVEEGRPPSDTALPPLEALAYVQNKAIAVLDALEEHMKNAGVTAQQVTLFNGVLKEARQSAKNRHELVHGKKYVVNNQAPTRPELKDISTDALKARRDELMRQLKEGDK